MQKTVVSWMYRLCVAFVLLTGGTALYAQDEDRVAGEEQVENAQPPGADAEAETGKEPDTEEGSTTTFWDIIYGGHLVNLLVWILIALTSIATVSFIIDSIITIKRQKLLPPELVHGVRESLNEGDLNAALETCEQNPGPLSTILMVGFSNITEGYEVIQEAVASSAEMENEKLMQRVNYLNLCGQIAPMLGLMGTVIGMVYAFAGLAEATGAAKATMLANSISMALWTTCVGLLISVPALLAFTLIKNYATRLLLETEATVLDLIKVLRNAEVEEG